MSGFVARLLEHGVLHDARRSVDQTICRGFHGSSLELTDDGSHYGYVHSGSTTLRTTSGTFTLEEGMYFTSAGPTTLDGGSGFIATRLGHRSLFGVGGPIEPVGRLRYIDGCTDSLLIAPNVLGDPCLNHLHIPASTEQTRHTHPSLRIGIIAAGRGHCVTPERSHALSAGLVFAIEPDCAHSFHTDDSFLDVVVYHPDSDHGPTHEEHPMINKTIIGHTPPMPRETPENVR